MFAEKDRKQHSGDLASSFKIREKHAGNVQRAEQPLNSLQMWQRSLGNQYLNSVSLTGVQPHGLLIQRTYACGGSCVGCMQREDDQRMLQPKLVVGAPDDKYEQEAERVAEQVMRMPEPRIQRVCPECEEELQREPREEEEEEEETLQTKPLAEQITPLVQRQSEPMEEEEEEEEEEETLQTKTTSGQPPTVSPSLQNRITALQGGGKPLPHSERAFFEPRFGADFSQVRVHTDSQAAETARAVNARAFTLGRDIVFGTGQYQPSASEGRQLLAHELTHFIQQGGKRSTLNSSDFLQCDPNKKNPQASKARISEEKQFIIDEYYKEITKKGITKNRITLEMILTNKLFWQRHPKLAGKKLSELKGTIPKSKLKKLKTEWTNIRKDIVTPTLKDLEQNSKKGSSPVSTAGKKTIELFILKYPGFAKAVEPFIEAAKEAFSRPPTENNWGCNIKVVAHDDEVTQQFEIEDLGEKRILDFESEAQKVKDRAQEKLGFQPASNRVPVAFVESYRSGLGVTSGYGYTSKSEKLVGIRKAVPQDHIYTLAHEVGEFFDLKEHPGKYPVTVKVKTDGGYKNFTIPDKWRLMYEEDGGRKGFLSPDECKKIKDKL